MTIRSAQPDDLLAIQALLRTNGLPADDLADHLHDFIVAVDPLKLIGVVGLESCGEFGLLRSLAVNADQRRAGLGAKLCESVESRARGDGVRTLFLLTTTAEAYFAARGYQRIGRDGVPTLIARTREFAHLCPSTAICMQKHLS